MNQEFCKAIGLNKASDHNSTPPEILSLLEKGDNIDIRKFLSKKKLPYLNAGGRDPVALFLFNLRRWQILFVILGGLMIGLFPGFISWLEGTFYYPPDIDKLCFIEDYGYLNHVLAMTALLLMNVLYFAEFPRTVLKLNISNVFHLGIQEWTDFINKSNAMFGNRLCTRFPYGLSFTIITIAAFAFLLRDKDQWYRISFTSDWRWAGIASIPTILITYYLAALLVVRIIGVYLTLREFFNSEPTIQPLHPDNCGGLASLGGLSMKLNLGVFLMGVICVLGVYVNLEQYSDNPWKLPLNAMIILGYFIGSSIMFFLPMYSAHHAMGNSKNQMLQIISDRHLQVIQDKINAIKGNQPINKDDTEELDSLKNIYDVASKMPVYPFNFSTVTSYLGSIITPILTLIITEIIPKYVLK